MRSPAGPYGSSQPLGFTRFAVIPVCFGRRWRPARRLMAALWNRARLLSVGRVEFQVLRDLALPAVAVIQQPLLVVVELLAGLDGELQVRPLDDGVDRAGLLAQAAVDALDHVD